MSVLWISWESEETGGILLSHAESWRKTPGCIHDRMQVRYDFLACKPAHPFYFVWSPYSPHDPVRRWYRWYVQYAADVKNLLFLARLEFLHKTGCVPHYFQYKEVTFLFFPQNLRLKFFIIRFLTSVAYCTQLGATDYWLPVQRLL